MTPEELLSATEDAASYFLKSKDTAAIHYRLSAYTLEDIAMDGVVAVLEAVGPQGLPDVTRSYVLTVVRNVCLQIIRRGSLDFKDSGAQDDRTIPLLSVTDVEGILLDALPVTMRALYDLHFSQGLSDAAIGILLGTSERTVRRRLVDLRALLEALLVP
jgi:DNA-directed RNA polymerase specialized sigma24 family protein